MTIGSESAATIPENASYSSNLSNGGERRDRLLLCQSAMENEERKTVQWRTLLFSELTGAEVYALLRLRQQVFVVEQNCAYLDLDDLDQQATHMLCEHNSKLLAYQRCLAPGVSYAESSLGRIVVSPTMRGRALGRELVLRGIEHNLRQWPGSGIRINAQAHLQDFYAALGFVAEGTTYLEDNILHRQMRYRPPGTPATIC